MYKSIFAILSIYLFSLTVQAQSLSPTGFTCNMSVATIPNTPFGMGLSKPVKTPPTNNINSQMRVLLVFVEFANDREGPTDIWAPGSLPYYANELFAPQKELGINAYQNYGISNYFNKISNDQFDVIGDVYHVTLNHDYNYYTTLDQAQTEVFSILDNSFLVDWSQYDQWRYNSLTQQYEQFPDNYVDMMYIQYRRISPFGITSGGYASAIVDYTTRDNKQISAQAVSYIGSGVTGINGAVMPKTSAIGFFRHEYCHYVLGNHRPYSTILGQDGTNTICGSELAFSPQDLITVGLANVITYSGLTNSFELRDMATTGDVLKIPTGVSGEYFLVCNRRRLAGDGTFTWDCNMIGDTAKGIPYQQFHDYSKGLYIYHVNSGDNFESWADLEAADGLWNWEHTGTSTPDWSNEQTLALVGKTGPAFDDDNPMTSYYYDASRYLSRDGQSVISQYDNPYPGWGQKWFSVGKRHVNLGEIGTDRAFTNNIENWTSRENMGDRWDAWSIGFNQVFSPFSSPNTKNRANNNTGIYVYYQNLSNDVATVKVYQGTTGTLAEANALSNTPPSRPVLYREVQIANCNGSYGHPRITWDNNTEPDMLRGGGYKRYIIYRAGSNDANVAPLTYFPIGSYNDYSPNDTANFIDDSPINGVRIFCSPKNGYLNDTYWRYVITAVDVDGLESNRSDFVSVKGRSEIPEKKTEYTTPIFFELKQNYPNPFNPATKIEFDLPEQTNVSVKVYNLLGEEVATLINNELRNPGTFTVSFDGTNLASGIYYYKIEAGSFVETKKMVLIK